MHGQTILRLTAMIVIACGMCIMLNACEQDLQTQQNQQPAANSTSTPSGQGAQSALGKAHESAQNVAADLENRSQEIADSIDNY